MAKIRDEKEANRLCNAIWSRATRHTRATDEAYYLKEDLEAVETMAEELARIVARLTGEGEEGRWTPRENRLRELVEKYTHPDSVMRLDVLGLISRESVASAARRLQMVIDDLYTNGRISMEEWESVEMELRKMSWMA